MKINKKKNGFTLIELMIVIAIIGILASIAVPKFIASTESAKVAKVQADLQIISSATMLYYSDHGKYPDNLKDLVDKNDLKKGYLNAVPKAPNDSDYDISNLKSKGEVTFVFNGKKYSSFGDITESP